MSRPVRLFMGSVVAVSLGCESARPRLPTFATARSALRDDVIGCWALAVTPSARNPVPSLTTMRVRLDTSAAPHGRRGERALRRLDSAGNTQTRDAEGFSVRDSWSADSLRDRIRLAFNNGLYGSVWVFVLPATSGPRDTLRGESQECGDVEPPPPEPVRPSVGWRVRCPTTPDSSAGV